MTGDPEPHPDRPPPARPVRVARFDAFVADGPAPEGEPAGRRVADVDVLADAGRSPARVAGFDGLDGAAATPATVADIDGLDDAGRRSAAVAGLDIGSDRDTRPRRTPARPDRRRPRPGGSSGRTSAADVGSPAAAAPPTDAPPADPQPADPQPSHAPFGDAPSGAAPSGDPPAGAAPSGETSAGDALPGDGGVPPDRPLPRGRRRGARVGRLGPDAPEPGLSEPDADPVAVAREICLRLLTDRARTREELARALARKGVPGEAAAAVLDRFDEVGLIDDAAFAAQWVRSRHTHRGLGRRAIAVELRRKGVADEVAGEALAEVDAESEAHRARELVDRKLRSLAVATPEQRAVAGRRLVGMLARRGYGAGTAYRVVREALAERGAEADELGSAADAPDDPSEDRADDPVG
jgi:regulatory protein